MERKYVDCRDYPGASKCSVAIYADTADELLEVAVQHAVAAHGQQDSPELRASLREAMKEEQAGAR